MKPAYYNEIDAYCAQWLRNLIDAGHIPAGNVDERDIREVQPDELKGYGQCHFFAGIGGFAYAARLAGLPDDADIWTGGFPCQDASVAASIQGCRRGLAGERTGLVHIVLDLIAARKPDRVVLENVPGLGEDASKIASRLEMAGYSVRIKRPKAADVGAPHPRQRLFFVAHRNGARLAVAGSAGPPEASRDPWASLDRDPWRTHSAGAGLMDDGVSYKLGAVRTAIITAAGNAIVPQSAAVLMRAFHE